MTLNEAKKDNLKKKSPDRVGRCLRQGKVYMFGSQEDFGTNSATKRSDKFQIQIHEPLPHSVFLCFIIALSSKPLFQFYPRKASLLY